jgi:sugar lactone lactonase YvrE
MLEVFSPPFSALSTPVLDVTGAASGFDGLAGIAIDRFGNLYGMNEGATNTVTIHAQPFTLASVPQVKFTLPVSANNPYTLSLDLSGNIWIGDRRAALSHLFEYSPPFTNSSVPALTLTNANGLTDATGTAFDRAGHMAVGQEVSKNVLVYNMPLTATSMPFATIPLAGAGQGVAFDSAGNLYAVLESAPGGVEVFHPPFTNGEAPAFSFGSAIGAFPTFDSSGNLWVPDFAQHVNEYSPPFSAASPVVVSVPLVGGTGSATGVAFGP